MRIDFPDHPIGEWERCPFRVWLLTGSWRRRRHWRWTVDHKGCECVYYWEYAG